MRILLVALQLLSQNPGSADVRPMGSGAAPDSVWARADSAIRDFSEEWLDAWMRTELDRPPGRLDMRDNGSRLSGRRRVRVSIRVDAVHCHWMATPLLVADHLIRGRTVSHASCPIWFPEIEGRVQDERRAIDNGLARAERWPIALRRDQLRALLESLGRQYPGDMRLTEQRVRFALDAGAFRDAWGAASSCAGSDARCLLLRGLVFHRAGHAPEADSLFMAALSLMGERERCEWSEVAVLLEPADRRAYEAKSCAARAETEARLWWLSDPLWLEPGNERRAEQFDRKLTIALLESEGDLRQRLAARKGGEAVAETLLRYGWPTHIFWQGPLVDQSHGEWLRAQSADTAAPYVVREYSRGRLHTVPPSAVLASPFTSSAADWGLDSPDDYRWWPVEHFARDRGRIVQLPDGQSALLLRAGGSRFAWAADLDPKLLDRRSGDTVQATLFDARSPGEVRAVASFTGRVGRPLVVDGLLSSGPALLGIELGGDSLRPAARTRFGAQVPSLPPVAALPAVSQPLLYDPLGTGERRQRADSAIARMYGSTTLPRFVRIGVYWEGYGFGAQDTVDVGLELHRLDGAGLLDRVGLRHGRRDGIALRWRDAPDSGAIQSTERAVPVQMRSIALDVSELSPGTYELIVTMNGFRSAPRQIGLR